MHPALHHTDFVLSWNRLGVGQCETARSKFVVLSIPSATTFHCLPRTAQRRMPWLLVLSLQDVSAFSFFLFFCSKTATSIMPFFSRSRSLSVEATQALDGSVGGPGGKLLFRHGQPQTRPVRGLSHQPSARPHPLHPL